MRAQEYPSPREIVSFEDWLATKYGERPLGLLTARERELLVDHIETRATYAEYVVLTWEHPQELLVDRFPLEEIGDVMKKEHHVYANPRLPLPLRLRAWAALSNLFQVLFNTHCSTSLGLVSSLRSATRTLDSACYMWWEYSPYFPEQSGLVPEDHEQFFNVCESCLNMSNPAVQESALHGLGHAQIYKPARKRVEDVIGRFLNSEADVRSDVARYARRARKGRVQ